MSLWTLVYDEPQATIERHERIDAHTGLTHEAYLWDCACGAHGQCASIVDAKADVQRHRRTGGHAAATAFTEVAS